MRRLLPVGFAVVIAANVVLPGCKTQRDTSVSGTSGVLPVVRGGDGVVVLPYNSTY